MAMLRYLLPILGLAALCAGWVLFQLWLKRVDPDAPNPDTRCAGCGGCRSRNHSD